MVLKIGRVLWDPSIGKASFVWPFISILGLPRPLNPTTSFFVCDYLGFPILSQESFVFVAECRSISSKTSATTNASGVGVTSIISRANTAAVKVFGTVVSCGGPLSNNGQQARWGESRFIITGIHNMFCIAPVIPLYSNKSHKELPSRKVSTHVYWKHLVDVGIEKNIMPLWLWHETIPITYRLECIVNHDDSVALPRGAIGLSE